MQPAIPRPLDILAQFPGVAHNTLLCSPQFPGVALDTAKTLLLCRKATTCALCVCFHPTSPITPTSLLENFLRLFYCVMVENEILGLCPTTRWLCPTLCPTSRWLPPRETLNHLFRKIPETAPRTI